MKKKVCMHVYMYYILIAVVCYFVSSSHNSCNIVHRCMIKDALSLAVKGKRWVECMLIQVSGRKYLPHLQGLEHSLVPPSILHSC